MNSFKNRKSPRFKFHDYSNPGSYHLILCSKNKKKLFSKIEDENYNLKLTNFGKIIKNSLDFLNKNDNLSIDKYVIMPNHLHILVTILGNDETFTKQNSTIPKLVSSLKRFTNKESGINLWQDSYYDSIIKNEKMYYEVWKYIDENPIKWTLDKYYTE